MYPLVKSFKFALNGIKSCIKTERNFRIHLVAAFYVLFFAVLGRLDMFEFAVIFACFGMVLIPEMLNTSIEILADVVTREKRESIMYIKDIAAGAVCIAAICAAAAGAALFFRREVVMSVYRAVTDMPLIGMAAVILLIPALIFIKGSKKDGN